MSPAALRALSVVNGWETVRYELLQTRLSDLGVTIEESPLEWHIERLYHELDAKHIAFKPRCYLTDGWGCPNEVPIVGLPFYLADKRLARLEEEQTGELEDDQFVMMLLRHEAGHAINYAFRLWEYEGWAENFGRFSKPYRDHYLPNPASRQFVRHISHHKWGRTYAQKHPDEDFAETFAVWLTPRSAWRRKYRYWPALKKLQFMDSLMRQIRDIKPDVKDGPDYQPIGEMNWTLAEHYGKQAERYRAEAQGYVDDKLRQVFPTLRTRRQKPAASLIQDERLLLSERVVRWSSLEMDEVAAIVDKLADRAEFLSLRYRPKDQAAKILDLVALVTSLAMDFNYTGRLTG
jgi:hypothetical protein